MPGHRCKAGIDYHSLVMTLMQCIFPHVPKPIIGMLHLPALPGAPLFGGDLVALRESVLRDASTLCEGGVHGLMIENFGDVPFFKTAVPPHVVSYMTSLAAMVRQHCSCPLGVNVLRNDAPAALAVAVASGASYIRVNVLAGAAVTDQGIIESDAAHLIRYRAAIGATDISIMADVRVKHASVLGSRSLEDEVDDLIHRAGADALIVSGSGTGQPTDVEHLGQVKHRSGIVPVFVGSGVTPETIGRLAEHADGFVIGSFFKQGRDVSRPVDRQRVREIMSQVR